MKKLIAFSFLCLLLLFLPLPSLAWEARVVGITDGDTITVESASGGDRVKIRLHGIDAPELRQPYGQAAKSFLMSTVLFKKVDVQPTPQRTDRYGRVVAIVKVPDVGILQELLLERGLAWIHPKYCKNCSDWEVLQLQAQNQQRGLWIESQPISPWEWRKM